MLIEFYGKECIHCMRMTPLMEKLENESGLKIEKYEVWHDDANAKKMEGYDKGECGGVPLFINTDTGKKVCGETSYEELLSWATGK